MNNDNETCFDCKHLAKRITIISNHSGWSVLQDEYKCTSMCPYSMSSLKASANKEYMRCNFFENKEAKQ